MRCSKFLWTDSLWEWTSWLLLTGICWNNCTQVTVLSFTLCWFAFPFFEALDMGRFTNCLHSCCWKSYTISHSISYCVVYGVYIDNMKCICCLFMVPRLWTQRVSWFSLLTICDNTTTDNYVYCITFHFIRCMCSYSYWKYNLAIYAVHQIYPVYLWYHTGPANNSYIRSPQDPDWVICNAIEELFRL